MGDCVEGVCVQTETVLRQALQERVKPVVMINKMDRIILELQAELEDTYQNFVKILENANVIIATYNDDALGDCQVFPDMGTVAFGSGLQSWAFTLNHFATLYAAKFKTDADKLIKKMWGNNFFDPKSGKWSKKEGANTVRGFCKFVLEPIFKMFRLIMDGKTEKYTKLINMVGVNLTKDEQDLVGKPLVKTVMRKWLPASDAPRDDYHPPPIPGQGPGLPLRVPVRGTPRRSLRPRHEDLRPQGRTHGVHLQDGAHRGQLPLRGFRPCVLWDHHHRTKGSHHGPQLRAREQAGPSRQEHPAYPHHDGWPHRVGRRRALWQHCRHRRY